MKCVCYTLAIFPELNQPNMIVVIVINYQILSGLATTVNATRGELANILLKIKRNIFSKLIIFLCES